ncbi:MAG: hypothetical protein KAI24_03800 [Planctomycetes bacterium]|nr:hypothetical protein [Planctomycetota bacterium]
MRRTRCVWLLLLAGCASSGAASLDELLADSAIGQPARLTVDGGAVVAFATPVAYRALPPAARLTCDTIAPDGELTFCAFEHGARGAGFRVEKRYGDPDPHDRSVLVDEHGAVLERSHTLPVARVPQHVLATALTIGTFVESAAIVSGPVREEFWRVLVKDRRGRTFALTIELDGQLRANRRRKQARVDSSMPR